MVVQDKDKHSDAKTIIFFIQDKNSKRYMNVMGSLQGRTMEENELARQDNILDNIRTYLLSWNSASIRNADNKNDRKGNNR